MLQGTGRSKSLEAVATAWVQYNARLPVSYKSRSINQACLFSAPLYTMHEMCWWTTASSNPSHSRFWGLKYWAPFRERNQSAEWSSSVQSGVLTSSNQKTWEKCNKFWEMGQPGTRKRLQMVASSCRFWLLLFYTFTLHHGCFESLGWKK